MMTWGVNDFIDEKGEQDGKFMISLVFPNDDFSTPSTNTFLNKIKSFEDKFLDNAPFSPIHLLIQYLIV